MLFKTTGELVSRVKLVERLSPYNDRTNLHLKHIPNDTFKLLTPTIRSIHIQTISDKTNETVLCLDSLFSLTESV